jgi:MFS family permease
VSETVAALAAGGLGAVFNLYLRALGLDAGFIGTFLTVTGGGAALGAAVGGRLVDRLGSRGVLLASSVVTAAGVLAQLLVAQPVILLIGGVVSGAGAAAYYVAAAPFLERSRGRISADRAFSVDTALTLGATAVGTALAGQAAALLLGAQADARWAYWITLMASAGIGATSFLALALTRPESGIGARQAAAHLEVGRASWRVALRDPGALRLTVCAALIAAGAGLFAPYVNLFFVEELGASPAIFGWLSAVAMLTRLVATLLAPRLSERFGTARTVGVTQLASVPLLLMLGFSPSLHVAGGAFLARGALMNMAAPLHVSLRMRVLPPTVHGAGNALVTLGDQVTRVASTWLGGQLITSVGYRPPYLATAACYVASALLFLLWFGRGAKR